MHWAIWERRENEKKRPIRGGVGGAMDIFKNIEQVQMRALLPFAIFLSSYDTVVMYIRWCGGLLQALQSFADSFKKNKIEIYL